MPFVCIPGGTGRFILDESDVVAVAVGAISTLSTALPAVFSSLTATTSSLLAFFYRQIKVLYPCVACVSFVWRVTLCKEARTCTIANRAGKVCRRLLINF